MSIDDLNYNRIVERLNHINPPSIGITSDNTSLGEPSQTGDRVIIRQNNIIIEQLIDIMNLLNTLVNQASTTYKPPDQLDTLISQIKGLSLEPFKRTVYSGPRLVWHKKTE